jgi:hypothetical protein
VRTRWIVAALLALVGLTFIGQGLGYVGGSAMSGSSFWAGVGIILLVVAGFVAWTAFRARLPA